MANPFASFVANVKEAIQPRKPTPSNKPRRDRRAQRKRERQAKKWGRRG